MGTHYLSDTNTVIEFLGGAFPAEKALWMESVILENRNNLSVINQIELLGFDADPHELNTIDDFVRAMTILPLSDDIVKKTIALRRSFKIKLPDAIIAATALVHHLVLITRNIADFKHIPGLTTMNLWEFEPEI